MDTLHLWLASALVDAGSLPSTIQALTGATDGKDRHTGAGYVRGWLGPNLRVSINEQGMSVKGSLAKYFLSDNFHQMTRQDTARAFEKMSDELHQPISKAKVTRLDFAQNLFVKNEPTAYFPYLSDCPYLHRFIQEKSLYFQNKQRQVVFYDKIVEGKSKGETLPNVWKDKNVLRLELRLKKKLTKVFNRPEVTGATLCDEAFYIKLYDLWHEQYKKINKTKNLTINIETMNSPKDFFKQLEVFAISAIGHDKIMEMVEDMKARKVFDKPEYYSRLKQEVKRLCNTPGLSSSSDLVEELDKKVSQAKRCYR